MTRDHDDDAKRFGLPRLHGRRFRAGRGINEDCFQAGIEHPKASAEGLDEILERLWMFAEDGNSSVKVEELLEGLHDNEATVAQALKLGLVSSVNGAVRLEPTGEIRARQVIRRHRLAEVLLHEILELEEEEIEPGACQFEHILSAKVADSICTLLGHPPTCPHGKPIPRGDCCEKFKRELTPLVVPLNELVPGETVRIVFITPKTHARLDRLGALGIVPGSTIRLHQKLPTFVLEIGETDVAIDPEIAREIFVRRL
jgi:DtxR family transcriptional regulator, Mn-dependent transcriptional regulator